uniref:Uncharacterized protein n=1 Tax=uncultured marine microorganism HF4000_137B17 TaxID=455523 RepID=B3T273_9ZZZZ|nr:hypothetical protein ALOHA_HF4000137B17ctg1g19 [uncultured marine microorganism HF4000_137B17]
MFLCHCWYHVAVTSHKRSADTLQTDDHRTIPMTEDQPCTLSEESTRPNPARPPKWRVWSRGRERFTATQANAARSPSRTTGPPSPQSKTSWSSSGQRMSSTPHPAPITNCPLKPWKSAPRSAP